MILTATTMDGAAGSLHYRAGRGEVTIGRGADCDWTLPDPTRQLSKRHCRMTAAQGGWRLTDLSSNGMTLNDRTVTPGVSHPVAHGDRLGMGSYDITVSLQGAFDGPPSLDDRDAADSSPFGDGRQGGRLIGDPFASPESELITDPFDVALPPLFEGGDAQPSLQTGGVASDSVSALQQPFEPPRPASALLPPDWDEPLQAAPASRPSPSAPEFGDMANSLSGVGAEPPPLPSPRAMEPLPPPPVPAPIADPVPVSAPPPIAAPLPAFELADDTASVPRRSVPAGPDAAALRAFAAFARGAGLEGTPAEAPEEALEKLGRAFRAYVVGLRRLLIARATVKGEFRIDRTMIRPFGNNPIKFATDDDDAMSALLGIGRQVGMTAEQAVADSIRDVRAHELALNQAFGHAVQELVEEMSPDRVAAALQPGPFDAVPILRNNRRWHLFEQRHAKLRASLDNSLDSVFGQAFARGYEAALARVSESDGEDAPTRTGRTP